MDNVIKEIIADVSEKTGVSEAEVEDIYMSVFRFIRDKIENIDFAKIETEEDFRAAKTNFNIPRILKLYTTPKRVEYVKAKIGKVTSPYVQGVTVDNNAEERSTE